MRDDDQDVDGQAPGGGVLRLDGGGVLDEEQRKIPRIVPPRADYQKHGFTQRCPGCRAMLLGTSRQKHSEACRLRMATEMADEEKVRTAKRRRQEFMKIAMEVQEIENIKKDEVVAQGGCDQVGGSSSSAALWGTHVVMHTQAKRDRSEDDQTDLTERLNKRTKEMSAAEEMEVAETTVNQEDEMESWSFGDEAQWAMDDHSGRTIDVELVKEARAEEVTFMESLPVWEMSSLEECRARTGKDTVSTKRVDIDKGRDGEVLIRSRLCSKGFQEQTCGERRGRFRGDASAGGQEVVAPHGDGKWRCGWRREARACETDVRGRQEGPPEWNVERL